MGLLGFFPHPLAVVVQRLLGNTLWLGMFLGFVYRFACFLLIFNCAHSIILSCGLFRKKLFVFLHKMTIIQRDNGCKVSQIQRIFV